MSCILPEGELVRRAAAFIAAERSDNPHMPLSHLLDKAGMCFNLSPLESEALEALFTLESAHKAAVDHRAADS